MTEPEQSKERPEWPPYTDVGLEWDKEAWAYIKHLENVEYYQRAAIDELNDDTKHLEGEISTLKEHLRRADKNIEAKEKYIEEIRAQL